MEQPVVRRRRGIKTEVPSTVSPPSPKAEETEIAVIDATIGTATDLQTREAVRLLLSNQIARLDPTMWPFAIAPTHQHWKDFVSLYIDPKQPPPTKLEIVNVLDKSLSVNVNGIILPLNLLYAATLVHLTFTTRLIKNERRLPRGLETYIGGMTKRAFAASGQI